MGHGNVNNLANARPSLQEQARQRQKLGPFIFWLSQILTMHSTILPQIVIKFPRIQTITFFPSEVWNALPTLIRFVQRQSSKRADPMEAFYMVHCILNKLISTSFFFFLQQLYYFWYIVKQTFWLTISFTKAPKEILISEMILHLDLIFYQKSILKIIKMIGFRRVQWFLAQAFRPILSGDSTVPQPPK